MSHRLSRSIGAYDEGQWLFKLQHLLPVLTEASYALDGQLLYGRHGVGAWERTSLDANLLKRTTLKHHLDAKRCQ
jgi:hypothetical protein